MVRWCDGDWNNSLCIVYAMNVDAPAIQNNKTCGIRAQCEIYVIRFHHTRDIHMIDIQTLCAPCRARVQQQYHKPPAKLLNCMEIVCIVCQRCYEYERSIFLFPQLLAYEERTEAGFEMD